MKQSKCNSIACALVSVSALVGIASCAHRTDVAIAEPIGPTPTAAVAEGAALPHVVGLGGGPETLSESSASDGRLVVHTDVAIDTGVELDHQDGRRLSYAILDLAGHPLQSVNVDSGSPALVSLQPGDYLVRADTLEGGTVQVRAHVSRGETTEIYLDGSRRLAAGSDRGVVRGSDGSFLGWRAGATR